MKNYEDRANQRQVWEQHLEFKENGGYFFKINYIPKNVVWKIFHKIGLIDIKDVIVEIEKRPMDWEYVNVNFTTDLSVKGIFITNNYGIKCFRMTVPNEIASKYDIKINFEKLYS